MGMIKTYTLRQSANPGKIEKVINVVKAYRVLAASLAKEQWVLFQKTGSFNRDLDAKQVKTPMSARYKQTCQYQIVGMLDSFIANRQNDFVTVVRKSLLEEDIKHKLFIINRLRLWQMAVPFSQLKHKMLIDIDTIKLARKIFSRVLSMHRKPTTSHINMALDGKVALVSDTRYGETKRFDHWVRFSTLEKGEPIYIPISSNAYYDDVPGIRKNFIQVNVSESNAVSFSFTRDVPARADYLAETDKLSLDLGLSTLFASNCGDLWGRTFFAVLKKYDDVLTTLAKNRQRQGLKTRSPKYDSLVDNIREFMKNEINRVLNRAVDIHKPAELVVERLSFRSPDLSRRMNRLISMFGKSLVQRKLDSLKSTLGITITETNAAYSSQECSVCGYVAKNNRPTQSEFKCNCCSTGMHADVNAARNHHARSSAMVIDAYQGTQTVLHILTERFLSDMERTSRHYRMAPGLLSSNPYFAGPLAQPKGFS
jgi:putative transposase